MGFVGRHLVTFIVKNQLASKVRVADKVPPATAWLNEEHKVSEFFPSGALSNILHEGVIQTRD